MPLGYTAPNTEIYPWLWLWDSCFHSLVWQALGHTDRALAELRNVFAYQDESGFVPHMGYALEPSAGEALWGRVGSSSISQPPMFGHTIASLVRDGVPVERQIVDAATAGLRFLLDRRPRIDGLIEVVHPWETGCDDSPRWDHFCPGGDFDLSVWRDHKSQLVMTIERGRSGEPVSNPAFGAAPVGFSAMVAWNARELASVTGDGSLLAAADTVADALVDRWNGHLRSWVDAGPSAETSGRIRTADALCALLVVEDPQQRSDALAELADDAAFGSRHGPRGVHMAEPTYDPRTYWRGPVWPQLAYLLWIATGRNQSTQALSGEIGAGLVRGAVASGFAEYWDGDTGRGGGAAPQSWAGLALVLAKTRTISPSSSG